VHLEDLVSASQSVADASARLQKVGVLAELLKRIPPDEIEIAVAFLSGSPRQDRTGLGMAAVAATRSITPADRGSLELRDVDSVFAEVATVSGSGSVARKAEILRNLFSQATRAEQDFLRRLIVGELRQGALEGILLEAVARAATISPARVRRAAMASGSLVAAARLALTEGARALDAIVIRPLAPVQPMLAQSAANVDEALAELGEASFEYKVDGARIQVHRAGADVRIFSRTLRDVTDALPEVVEAVRQSRARDAIFDAEAIALRPDGTPQPFQVTMRRFGRKLDVGALRAALPISAFFFDCLYVDGQALIDEPLSARADMLARVAPAPLLVPRIVTASGEEAARFANRALAAGHEGVMAKALTGVYAAGRRGQSWLKVKQARTLDLVILAVEWGSGRRKGTLSNLHLGARDEERGGFVMLGKTFKGLTDEMLAWQTRKLLELEVARDAYTVHVRPELVVEIAFNEIQESPHYPGRLALRFARVKRYRPDKPASQADTYPTVRALYQQMTGIEAPPRA
jgi:DNA ligase-1